MSRVSDHAKRSGFTLLELLIALSLVTTLMALGWSLFSTFARLESRARRTVSGLEIKRTFQRQLQDDLDQIVFFGPDLFKSLPPQAGVNELKLLLSENGSSFEIPLGGLPGFTSSESENPSGVSGSAPESHGGLDYLRQVFFEGDSDSLSFLIRRMPRLKNASVTDRAVTDDWMVVSYRWQIAGGDELADSPPEFTNQNVQEFDADKSMNNRNSDSGRLIKKVFVRRVVPFGRYQQEPRLNADPENDNLLNDFETIEISSNSNANNDGAGLQDLYGDEIVEDKLEELAEIKFRYFDGKSWASNWSSSRGEKPVAIEAIFKVKRERAGQQQGELADGRTSEFEPDGEFEIVGALMEEKDFIGGGPTDVLLDIHPDFKPDSSRILIRLGNGIADSNRQQATGKEPFKSEEFLDFEYGGIR